MSPMPSIIRVRGEGPCSVVFDTRTLPIVFSTWQGVPDIALIEAYFDIQTKTAKQLLERNQKMVLVTDGRNMGRATALGRQRIAELSNAQRELYGATMVGSCTVITSALLRGVITALGWLDEGMRVPTLPTLEAGVAWANEQLVKAGIPAPARVDLDAVMLAAANEG